MSDSNDTFVVLDPQSEGETASASGIAPKLPTRPKDISSTKPNFLIVTADSLGYSDLSCYGSEIRTPHIDSLASHGTRFTDFHTTAANSPSHAALLTGTDHHATGLGQTVETLMDSPAHRGKQGHEGYLTDQVASLPEKLRENGGYYTAMAGKWNLGIELEQCPR